MYENTGRLFKNDYKKADNHPDYKGDFTDASGKKMQVAAWFKNGAKGQYLSFSISEMKEKEKPLNVITKTDDGLPF